MNSTQVYDILKETPEISLDSVVHALRNYINLKDRLGYTPLLEACREGREYLALKFIEKGADINVTESSGGNTPLIWACYGNLVSVASKLIEMKADLNERDSYGKTAVDYIKEKWSRDAEKIILEKIESIYKPVVSNPIIVEQTETKPAQSEVKPEPKPEVKSEPKPAQPEVKPVKLYPVGMLNIPYLIENNITFTHENGQITLL